jgi:hypothetical protein
VSFLTSFDPAYGGFLRGGSAPAQPCDREALAFDRDSKASIPDVRVASPLDTAVQSTLTQSDPRRLGRKGYYHGFLKEIQGNYSNGRNRDSRDAGYQKTSHPSLLFRLLEIRSRPRKIKRIRRVDHDCGFRARK